MAVGGRGVTGSACIGAVEEEVACSEGGGGGGNGASWRSRRSSCGAVEKNSATSGCVSCMTVGASEWASEGTEGASEQASSSERTSCMRAMSDRSPSGPRGGSVAKAEGDTRGPFFLLLPSGRFFASDDGNTAVDGSLVRWGWLGGGRCCGEGSPCRTRLSYSEQELVGGRHGVHVAEGLAPAGDEAPGMAHGPVWPDGRGVTDDSKPKFPRRVDDGLNCEGRRKGVRGRQLVHEHGIHVGRLAVVFVHARCGSARTRV